MQAETRESYSSQTQDERSRPRDQNVFAKLPRAVRARAPLLSSAAPHVELLDELPVVLRVVRENPIGVRPNLSQL